jgi:catechol-2,3-dioxygenase
MADGSCLAFFDLGDNTASQASANTPAWVNHIALRVESEADLTDAKRRLEAAGVEVLGVTDHHFIKSIYFFDPNGIRLELTTYTGSDDYMRRAEAAARPELDAWTSQKAARAPAAT